MINSSETRRAAAEILRERRFQTEKSPQPLRGVLIWIGDRLIVLGRPFGWLRRHLDGILPGGGSVVWIVMTVTAIAILSVLTWRVTAVRTRRVGIIGAGSQSAQTADELERLASEAEAQHDFAHAVRLRFRAGLRRLAESNVLRAPEHRPNGDLALALSDTHFESLARRFDQVAYGAVVTTAEDLSAAKLEWPIVVENGREQARIRRRETMSGTTTTLVNQRRWWSRFGRWITRRDRTKGTG